MAAATPFSLGYALFEWPSSRTSSPDVIGDIADPPPAAAAPQHTAHAPMAWQVSLLHAYLDGKGRLALFRTCRGGRDLVLQHSAKATLNLQLSGTKQRPLTIHGLRSMVLAAGQAVSTRGHLPTTLEVGQLQAALSRLLLMPGLLCMTAGNINSMTASLLPLYRPPEYSRELGTAFLAAAGSALPNLTTLHLHPLPCILPEAVLLPQLTELHATLDSDTQTAVLGSILSYIRQLRSLHLQGGSRQPMWNSITASPVTSHTLTHMSLDMDLTDSLLLLVVNSTPALQHLVVHDMDLHSGGCASKQWQLKTLQLSGNWRLHAGTLSRLPRSDAPVLQTDASHDSACIMFTAVNAEGLAPQVASALLWWQLPSDLIVLVMPGANLAAEGHPLALKACLAQIAPLQTGSRPQGLLLGDWVWSAPSLRHLQLAIRGALQSLVSQVCLTSDNLKDELVSMQLQHAPCVRSWQAADIQLLVDHSASACQWNALSLLDACTLNLADTALLPATAALYVRLLDQSRLRVSVTAAQVQSGLVDRVKSRLAAMDIEYKLSERSDNMDLPSVWVECPPDVPVAQEPALLRACCDILRAVRKPRMQWRVRLVGWALTAELISELSGLPEYGIVLDLSECSWVPEAGIGLARAVPVQYYYWRLHGATERCVQEVISGLKHNDADAVREYRLQLVVGDVEWADAANASAPRLYQGYSVNVVKEEEWEELG